MNKVKITGIGKYIPPKIITNEEIVKILKQNREKLIQNGFNLSPNEYEQFETSDEWIRERTGIVERRFAESNETTSDLATKAAEEAIKISGLKKEKIEFLLLATVTPDYIFSPPTSSVIQEKLGLPISIAISDISAACSSFVYALALGYGLVASGIYKKGLVIGADIMSRTANWNDRTFSILFGDGAGALVLEADSIGSFTEEPFFLGSDGAYTSIIMTPVGGSKTPITKEHFQNPLIQPHTVQMNGREVFKKAVKILPWVIAKALKKSGLKISEIDLIIFHQANLRIIEAVTTELQKWVGFRSQVFNNIQKYGNTTSASIPLCLYEAWKQEILKPGMTVLVVGFGGGFTWATAIFQWPNLM